MPHAERAKVTGEEEGRSGAQWDPLRKAPQARTRRTQLWERAGGAGWWALGESGGWVYFIVFCAGDTISRGRQKACSPGVLPRWEGVSPPGLSVHPRPGRPVTQAQERAECRGLSGHPTPTPDRAIGARPLQILSGGARN